MARLRPSLRLAAASTLPASSASAASPGEGASSVTGPRIRFLNSRVRKVGNPLEVVARIGAVERFVAEREVGDDVAFDRHCEQRPLQPGRIAQMAALDGAVLAEANRYENIAAEGLGDAETFAGFAGFSERGAEFALRQPLKTLLDQLEALLDLAGADPQPCIDVAVIAHRHLEFELTVGRIGDRFPGVEGAARGAADVTPGAESARERRREIAGGDGTVLKSGGAVVDLQELGEAAAHGRYQFAQRLLAGGIDVFGDAPRHDAVHHQAMAEAGLRRSQGAFAQHAAFDVEEREGRVVADGADIAEMIGHAFEFGHDRAQEYCARRNLDLKRRFDRMREGERVSDGAVARSAARERRTPLDARPRHQPFDALMHIAEPLFEPRHGLAIGGETEMPGLDDAGMDRAYGNLMEMFAFDRQEVVGQRADARLLGLAERMGHAPEAEFEPGAGIGRA